MISPQPACRQAGVATRLPETGTVGQAAHKSTPAWAGLRSVLSDSAALENTQITSAPLADEFGYGECLAIAQHS